MIDIVLNILNGSLSPRAPNHTVVALFSKIKSPSTPKDFRPINLCNIIYKIVSKVLVN